MNRNTRRVVLKVLTAVVAGMLIQWAFASYGGGIGWIGIGLMLVAFAVLIAVWESKTRKRESGTKETK